MEEITSQAHSIHLEPKLLGDDGEISDWVNPSFDVRDIFIFKSACHVKNGVTRFNVSQKRITQTLTL